MACMFDKYSGVFAPVFLLHTLAEEKRAVEDRIAEKSNPVVNGVVEREAHNALVVPVSKYLWVPTDHPAPETAPAQNARHIRPSSCCAKKSK